MKKGRGRAAKQENEKQAMNKGEQKWQATEIDKCKGSNMHTNQTKIQ